MEENSRREQDANILSFHDTRPRQLAEHTAECLASVNEFTEDDVVQKNVEKGEFVVKSSLSDMEHKVYFGTDIVSMQEDSAGRDFVENGKSMHPTVRATLYLKIVVPLY
jgi:hypothetical protein